MVGISFVNNEVLTIDYLNFDSLSLTSLGMQTHRNILLVCICLLTGILSAQQKGVSLMAVPANNAPIGATRAVVVGISDYQDPAIPDLHYADKDAEAFAEYLRSAAGGSLDADHMMVLLNSEATMAQFANALDWLMEVTKEGDQAIIYFSGHGDVERKTITQPGFLLCWDAPPRVYMAGGAFALPMLQEVVSTLSSQNKAKVIVITDACRSGALAGSSIGGAQATTANLAKQFANEVKMLSCQPNEYSIEGAQWGGGRGAFSYNLIDGLYGLADENKDLSVSLREIERYLEDHVIQEVAPQSQTPMILGNKTEKLATVVPDLLAEVLKKHKNQVPGISPTDSRGLEDEVLAKVDSATRDRYRAFQQALKKKIFFEPADGSADTLYRQLIKIANLAPLFTAMRRNYAAALQDESQQAMNAWLKTDIREITLSRLSRFQKYRNYARYLDRAAELLGPDHYMYRPLQARKLLFEGIVARLQNLWGTDPELGKTVLEKYRSALAWQPDIPHAYLFMANNFGWNLGQPDSAYYYAMKAAEAAPYWVLPYTNTAYLLTMRYKQYDRAKRLLDQALAHDSTSAVVWNYVAIWHYKQKHFAEAEQTYRKVLQIDSSFTYAWYNLGLVYVDLHRYPEGERMFLRALSMDSTNVDANNNLGWLYVSTKRWSEAERMFNRAIGLDPSYPFAWNNLGAVYLNTNRLAEAEKMIRKSISLDSTNAYAYKNLGQVCQRSGRYGEAEAAFRKAISQSPTFGEPYFHLASLESIQGHSAQAIQLLQQSFDNGFRDDQALLSNPDFNSLRALPEFKKMISRLRDL